MTGHHKTKKLVFMGSPDFTVPILMKLLTSDHDVIAIYTQPPRPAGRKKILTPTPVHRCAMDAGVPVYHPEKLTPEECKKLAALQPDLICVAGYGLLLPQAVLDIAPCLNVHPSALPRWRGATPVQATLLAGDETTDVCVMQLETGMDSGPVYMRQTFAVDAYENSAELYLRLFTAGAGMLVDVIDQWDIFKDQAIPQKGEITHAPRFTKETLPQLRRLDFSKSACTLHNQVRALQPWPVAEAWHHETVFKLIKTDFDLTGESNAPSGTVLRVGAGGIDIACGTGVLTVQELQRPGARPMVAAEFLAGYVLNPGETLS